MSHLLQLGQLASAAASALARRRPQPPLPYPPAGGLVTQQWHYQPPEGPPPPRRIPIPGSPLEYQLVDRRDCQNCGGLWSALVRTDGFQCQHCQQITFLPAA